MSAVDFVVFDTEAEYKKTYVEVYVGNSHSLDDVPVIFDEKSFDHIFSEKVAGDSGERHFSKRRAKRIMFMAALLNGSFRIERMFEGDTGNYAVFCDDLECVMYLRPIPGAGLQVMTFFDFGQNHSKRSAQHKKRCIPASTEDIQKILESR